VKGICPAALGTKDQQPAAFSPGTGLFSGNPRELTISSSGAAGAVCCMMCTWTRLVSSRGKQSGVGHIGDLVRNLGTNNRSRVHHPVSAFEKVQNAVKHRVAAMAILAPLQVL
jgi:hypothetical protein